MRRILLLIVTIAALAPMGAGAWGVRAHTWINRVAVQAIPADGPVFLKTHEDWIAYLSVIPDAWRRPSEPFLKMLEDPNHGWFKEQFAFMTEIPRSRYEFVLKLYDEQRRLAAAGDPAATLTNVRWTGTMAYAAVEGYDRMVTGMRHYRDARSRNEDTRLIEQEIAFYMGWTGHYTADGAQPLHDTVHHDGWQGANPKGFTTNPQVHGLFETRFVDLMKLEGADLLPKVPAAKVLADPFVAILDHLDEAGRHTEKVYELEKRGALADGTNAEARALVIQQAARGATLLRDLAHTAWVRSGAPPENDPAGNPVNPSHPRYNPATGSAPAAVPGGTPRPPQGARVWQPLTLADPVVGKNFYLFEAIAKSTDAARAIGGAPDLIAIRDARLRELAAAAKSCGSDPACHAAALKWSDTDIAGVERALRSAVAGNAGLVSLADQDLRRSGLYTRYEHQDAAGRPDVALDPWAKMRLELAVARFRTGKAPFIIVSGGHVHPSQTRYNEAFEMKQSLVRDFGVSPDAILIDPHARHTTTNLRNASRLAFRYGMPVGRPMLITSDASQSAYISGTVFRERCERELGYQPGTLGARVSRFDLEFTPAKASLHADARDPLDP